MRTIYWFFFLLLLSVPTSRAKANSVTFEGLGDGTAVTNQFPNLLFFNADVATAELSLNKFEFPPHFGSDVVLALTVRRMER